MFIHPIQPRPKHTPKQPETMKDIYQQVGEWLNEMAYEDDHLRNEEYLLNKAQELLNTLYETYWEEQKK